MPDEFHPGWHSCPECGDEYYRDQHWKAICLDCYIERKGARKAAPPQPQAPAIPPDMWRRLLQLCHPDKHAGSEVATTTTQWLLQMKPNLRDTTP